MQAALRSSCYLAVLGFALSCAEAGSVRPLPGGERTSFAEVTAYLIDPTSNYERGVLGDLVEARGFAVERDGRKIVFRLPHGPVFEDRRVRLADLDQDGEPEAVVVKSYPDKGAAIAAYRILPDRIVPLAESPPIGRRHRWLNPVGIGDFTRTGEPMIAAVVRPHTRGSLQLYRLAGRTFETIARIDGFTNHIRGSLDLDLGRAVDIDADGAPEIIIPSADRSALAVVSFMSGVATVRKKIPVAGKIVTVESVDPNSAQVRTDFGPLKLSLQ